MKKSNVYTSTGDNGTTSLVGGKRVKKNDFRLDVYGTVDELNSTIGYLCAISKLSVSMDSFLKTIQNKLFNIGSYLATDNPESKITEVRGLTKDDVVKLEKMIDTLDSELPPLSRFILPGGSAVSGMAHICRTVTRRCERLVVKLAETTYVDPNVIKYLNRLSDFFFVFARFNNINNQIEEIFWDKES